MNICYPLDSLYVQLMINLMRCQVLTMLIDFLIENWILYGVNLLPEVTFIPERSVA